LCAAVGGKMDYGDLLENDHKLLCTFLAAAKVGGIIANSQNQADFIGQNLAISTNIINAAQKTGTKKLLNLGSACIYPKNAVQPITEAQLLTGALEPTNEGYAIAKIAAIKMCRYFNEQYGTNFMSVMPANLYGVHDNFDFHSSHVLPALIHKFHLAKEKRMTQLVSDSYLSKVSKGYKGLHVYNAGKAWLFNPPVHPVKRKQSKKKEQALIRACVPQMGFLKIAGGY